ncbi:MAG: HD domain-containing phosphohydrolase [Chloroflexota bacterium]
MSRLRWQLRTYIVGVILAGAAALGVATVGPRPSGTDDLLVIAILLGLATIAQVWPVHLSLKVKLTVDDTPLFAAALLLGPFVAMLVAVVSALLGLHFRNARMPWYNRAFTAAVSALATGAAAVVYLVLADGARPMLSQPLPIIAAGAARYLMQTSLVDVAVALQMKRRPFASWWTLHRRDLAQMAGLHLLGAIAAVSADGQPLALVLFAVPMVAMLLTLRDSARVREQTRAAILELADLIDLRDPYTHGHSQRVAALAERLARRLKLQYSQVELIRDAARVHDIGKIGTNDLVLLKAGPLDASEQAEMRRHVEIGHRLLRRLPEFWEGAELVLAHHERHDGKGYPRGLRGDELPLEVSVISVADTYDAMVSDRPYRRGMAWEQVRAELLRCRGTQWREVAVDAFIAMIEDERGGVAARQRVTAPATT